MAPAEHLAECTRPVVRQCADPPSAPKPRADTNKFTGPERRDADDGRASSPHRDPCSRRHDSACRGKAGAAESGGRGQMPTVKIVDADLSETGGDSDNSHLKAESPLRPGDERWANVDGSDLAADRPGNDHF